MNCPHCNGKRTRVVDSRVTDAGLAVRRRRVCARCEQRFTTYERLEELVPVSVSYRTGEPVERRVVGRRLPQPVAGPGEDTWPSSPPSP